MKLRVAVLYGGRSGEHEVSLRSAESIIAAMDPDTLRGPAHSDYQGRPLAAARDFAGARRESRHRRRVSRCCTALSAKMEPCRACWSWPVLPYVGAGVLASSVSMDKEVMKRLLLERGLPVVEYMVAAARPVPTRRDVCGRFPFPVFVKPANLGSSVGVSKAKTCEELKAALDFAAQFDRKILVERGIEGREFECSVLGNDDPDCGGAVRNSAFARFLRLRRQVPAQPGADRGARRSDAGADRAKCSGWRWNAIRRSIAKAWRASIS